MKGIAEAQRQLILVEDSPLRPVDPRVKLAMGSCASAVVMLPLDKLVIFLAGYVLFMAWARLLPLAARQVWRLKGLLVFLFVLDSLLISLELAVVVTLRLVLLAGVFTLVFATTTPIEFSLALEKIGLPYRYAFSLGLAFQSLNLLDEEWRTIQEAQRARRALPDFTVSNWRQLPGVARNLIALTVPAIVMTTKRAWSITEAAYARGFDSPHRRPARTLRMKPLDWFYLALTVLSIIILYWR
jgi:energy-coupling factor transporter transmembrane protein EcfT